MLWIKYALSSLNHSYSPTSIPFLFHFYNFAFYRHAINFSSHFSLPFSLSLFLFYSMHLNIKVWNSCLHVHSNFRFNSFEWNFFHNHFFLFSAKKILFNDVLPSESSNRNVNRSENFFISNYSYFFKKRNSFFYISSLKWKFLEFRPQLDGLSVLPTDHSA